VAGYEPRATTIDGSNSLNSSRSWTYPGSGAERGARSSTVHAEPPIRSDRTKDEAFAWIVEFLSDVTDTGDTVRLVDWAPPSPPSMTNERLASLVELTASDPREARWTDVATSPNEYSATNFGAGDPLLAHRSDEFVTLAQLDQFASVLSAWLK